MRSLPLSLLATATGGLSLLVWQPVAASSLHLDDRVEPPAEKQAAEESSGESSSGSAPASDGSSGAASESDANPLEGATVDENGRWVSADGRRQAVDSYGSPLVDPSGNPIWEPKPEEIAVQLFEEAIMLRKGIAGAEPDLMGAATRLNEVLSVVSDFPGARYNLGLVQLDLDLLKDARENLEKASVSKPEQIEVWISLGIAEERSGDFTAATRAFSAGLDRDPANVALLGGMARVYRKLGKPELAVDKAKAILKINSNSLDAYNTLGLGYLDMGELDLARFVFMKAEASVPGGDSSSAIQCNLGLVHYRMGNEFEAEVRFQNALGFNDSDIGAMVNLAHLKLVNFDFEGARELLETAHRKLPANVPIQLNLAVARRGTDDLDGAEALYDQIASAPGEYRDDAILNLAILQGDFRKDYESAIETYNEYLALMDTLGDPEAEDGPVRGYLKSVEKLKARADKRRQRDIEKAARKAEKEAEEAAEAARAAEEPPPEPEPAPVDAGEQGAEGAEQGAEGAEQGAEGAEPAEAQPESGDETEPEGSLGQDSDAGVDGGTVE